MKTDDIQLKARAAIATAVRAHHGQILALLIKDLRDFQLAEDCLQDALESALVHWARNGPPRSPAAWLVQTARRKAIDRLRRVKTFNQKSNELSYLMDLDQHRSEPDERGAIPDERLRLIFTCCHPALDPHIAVALSLRSICGLTTAEIARAFVVSEETMAQRLVRARQKISKAGIAYEVPEPPNLVPRLEAVLKTIYLTFNEGYAAAPSPQNNRVDLSAEAIRLGRLLNQLCPNQTEAAGLLSLMLFTHARRAARSTSASPYVPLEGQDRTNWDHAMIAEADQLLQAALAQGRAGVYALQAAINAVHSEAQTFAVTRWPEIVLLYDRLYDLNNNPVYLLNRAVAISYAEDATKGLAALEGLSDALSTYQPFHAARAHMLLRLSRFAEATTAYDRAIELSQNENERQFLSAKRQSLHA